MPVETWPYWSSPGQLAALRGSVFADVTSVMDGGIVLGALLAALLAGRFAPVWRIPARSLAAAVVGGLLLGYGARIAYGCNIGAYFSGIASGSLHGWLWLPCAFAGNVLGTYPAARRSGSAWSARRCRSADAPAGRAYNALSCGLECGARGAGRCWRQCASGCYESEFPLDADPLIDVNPALLGTWRCLPLDGEADEPPVTLTIARSAARASTTRSGRNPATRPTATTPMPRCCRARR